MIYGISGASGVGKSTVGRIVADALDIQFLEAGVSKSGKKRGVNPVSPLDLPDRLSLQEQLLSDYEALLGTLKDHVIIDRTPIDFACYLMAEIHMQAHLNLTDDEIERVCAYMDRCKAMIQENFDFVFHLTPLGFYEQSPDRPALNAAYQYHCDLIMRGMLLETSGRLNHAVVYATDIGRRQDFIHETISSRLNAVERRKRSTKFIN